MKKFEVKTKKTTYQVVARDSQHAKQKVLHIANRPMKDEDSTSDGKLIVGKTYIDEQGKKWVCKSISMGGFMVSFDNVDSNDQEASRSIIGYTPDSLEETWGLRLADKKVKDDDFDPTKEAQYMVSCGNKAKDLQDDIKAHNDMGNTTLKDYLTKMENACQTLIDLSNNYQVEILK